MKSSIGLTALVGSLMCISPIFGKDKLLGAFKNNFHDIAGDIYSKGDNQLVIEGFTYDGQGPDAFFWVGTKGKEPSSDGIILPHPFEGKIVQPRVESMSQMIVDSELTLCFANVKFQTQ